MSYNDRQQFKYFENRGFWRAIMIWNLGVMTAMFINMAFKTGSILANIVLATIHFALVIVANNRFNYNNRKINQYYLDKDVL